jgi:hypothetical protein
MLSIYGKIWDQLPDAAQQKIAIEMANVNGDIALALSDTLASAGKAIGQLTDDRARLQEQIGRLRGQISHLEAVNSDLYHTIVAERDQRIDLQKEVAQLGKANDRLESRLSLRPNRWACEERANLIDMLANTDMWQKLLGTDVACEIDRLIARKDKIAAIRRLRHAIKVRLLLAKDLVEARASCSPF